jgi:hypothetical protein
LGQFAGSGDHGNKTWGSLKCGHQLRNFLNLKKDSAPWSRSVGWFVGLLVGWLVCWLLVNWLAGWLVNWLVGWLVGWLIGWLVGWLVIQLITMFRTCQPKRTKFSQEKS